MILTPQLDSAPDQVDATRLDFILEPSDTENSIISQLPSLFSTAKSQAFSKFEIKFPLDWTLLPQLLTTFNFQPIIHTFNLSLPQNSLSSPLPNSQVKFSDLKPLLIQQADYHHQLYPEYYRSSLDIDWPAYLDYYTTDLLHPHSIYYHHPHGFIIGGYEDKTAHIWDLIVDENHRGLGIGQQLLQQFITTSTALKLNNIYVETGWNQPAQKLYLKNNFVATLQTWYFKPN